MAFKSLFYGEKYCKICLSEETSEDICENCRTNLEYVSGSIKLQEGTCNYIYFYNNFMKKIIQDFKFHKKTYLAKALAGEIYSYLEAENKLSYDFITYIPMYKKDEFLRGFNQGSLICDELSILTGIDKLDILKKSRHTREQNKISKEERKTNLKDSFSLKKSCKLEGKSILLIDDLVTTGATFNEALGTIKKKYNVKVDCLAICSSRNGVGDDEFL